MVSVIRALFVGSVEKNVKILTQSLKWIYFNRTLKRHNYIIYKGGVKLKIKTW